MAVRGPPERQNSPPPSGVLPGLGVPVIVLQKEDSVVPRVWMAAAAGALALITGCGGGGDGGEKGAAKPSGPPAASEPVVAAATRLGRAVPRADCRALGALMLHSASRGTEPTTPPTTRECAFVTREVRNELAGFKLTKAAEFGPGALTEGTGDKPRSGELVGVIWVLDRDGSWKAVYDAVFRPQIGLRPTYGARTDANARGFVAAVAARDCDRLWRLLNVGSRFVRGQSGDRRRFCAGLAPVYRDPKAAFAQIAKDPTAAPARLGATRDIGFYGLELANGRYMVIVMAGRLGGIADSEQREHDDPTVLEVLTVRRPPAS
jgi:hypothetical protein